MDRGTRRWATIAAALIAVAGAASAQAFDPPVTVPDSLGASDPSVAVSSAGRTVAAWNVPGDDGDQVAVSAAEPGGAFSPGIVVSDPSAPALDTAVLAGDPSGAAAVAWTAQPAGASRIDVVPALGAPRETVPGTGADTSEAAVGVAADGTVVVAWTATSAGRSRVFASVRAPGGGYAPRTALSDTAGDASGPTVDAAADGSAVVTWVQTSESSSTSGSTTTETSTTRVQAAVRSGGAFGPASTVATGTSVTVIDEDDEDAPILIDGDVVEDPVGARTDAGATTVALTRTTLHQQIPPAPGDTVTGRIEAAQPGGPSQPVSPPGQDAGAPSAAAGPATAAIAWEAGGQVWIAGGSGATFAPATPAGAGEDASAAVIGPAGSPLAAFTRQARPFAADPLRGAVALAPGDADSATARAAGAPTGWAAVTWRLDPTPTDGDELVRVAIERPAPAATPTPQPTATATPEPASTPSPAPTATPTPAAIPEPPPADTTPPRISRLRLSAGLFLLAPGRSKLRAAAIGRGARLRYRLSERAEVRITLVRMALLPGGKGGRRRCAGTRERSGVVERVGIYEATLGAGDHLFRLNGRVGRRALERGRYRLRIRATDRAGNHAPARERRFTLC